MYPNTYNYADVLGRSSIKPEQVFINPTPQANSEILKKAVYIGINYFSGFKGQKVIVTGASKGVGRFVAKSLLDAGAYVAMVSKNKLLLDSLARNYPGQAFPFAYDLSDPDELNICFKKIIEVFRGELDILIHCKGTYYNKAFEEASLKDWDDCMNTNTRCLVHFTSLCIPFLETSKGNKSIVILTTETKDRPISGELLYAVSKSMVNMFIQCLALDVAASKIRVNGVASTASNTIFRVSKDKGITEFENKVFLDGVSDIKPLQVPNQEKLPNPDDIANVILWLASNESSYVTGEIINIDDGMSLTSAYPKPKSMIS